MASVGSVNINVNYVVNNSSMRNVTNSINQLQNRAPRLQSTFTSAFGKIGAAITAAFSVKAITDFSKKALELASNLQEVQNVVDVTFEHMNEKINKFSKAAIVNLGMSETSAKKYAGTYGAMAKSFGFTTEEATNMAMAITSLTGDVASFYNLRHDLAYTKLKSIFTGETETLKDLGVVMTQTALNQYALANGYGKTVKEMTEQEKVVLRYRFVMEKLALAQGDFQRTQSGWANQTRILSERWNAIMASIGDGLIILLTPAIQALNKFLSYLQVATDKFAGFVAMLTGKKVETSSQAKAQAQIAAIGATATSSSEDLEDLADGYEGVGNAAKSAKDSLASFDNVVQLADTSSTSGASSGLSDNYIPEYTFTDNEELQESTTILDGLGGVLDKLKEKFSSIFEISESIKPSIERFVKSYINALKTSALSIFSVGRSIAESLVGGIALWLEEENGRITEQWTNIFNNFAGAYDNMSLWVSDMSTLLSNFFSLESTEQALADAMTVLESTVSGTHLVVSDLFSYISSFVANTIDDNFNRLNTFFTNTSKLLSTVTDTIKNIITDCFQSVHSVFEKYIRPAFEQFQEGFSRAFGAVVNAWNSSVLPMLQIVGDSFSNLWTNHLKPFVDEVLGMVGAFIECVATVYNKVISPIVKIVAEKFLPPIMMTLSVVWGAVEGLIQNVIDIVTGLVQFIKGVFQVISGLLQGDLKKVFEGVENLLDGLIKAIANVFSSIVNVIIGALNGVIRAANKIKVPGTDIGVNIPEIPRWEPKILLADGGIVYRETDFGNYIAGEAGAEAIVPLENSSYTKILAREIVNGMLEAGFGGDTYNISTAYLDKRGLEKLTQEINGVNKQLGARKGVIAYG